MKQNTNASGSTTLKNLRKYQKVTDTWFTEWGVGNCIKALKTRWHIKWSDGEVRVFDKSHLQFLELKK